MAVIFSHSTALAVLRAIPPQARILRPVNKPLSLAAVSTRAADLTAFDQTPYGIAGDVHVLASRSSSGVVAKGVTCHRSSLREVPAGLLYELQPNVYVCGPELVFLQMAAELSDVGLTVLGYELCGSYSQFSCMVSGFYDRKPLTSVERILKAMHQMPRAKGLSKARRALSFVVGGSRSPMETVVSSMLYLPNELGGYGLATPVLNRRVTLDAAAASRLGQKTCMIDACWPQQKVGLEYDSRAFHPNPERDRSRREALAHMGWTIYTLEPDDVSDVASLDRMVNLFLGAIPQTKTQVDQRPAHRAELLRRLFVLTRRGIGLNELLFAEAAKSCGATIHL